jgi:hypothetical protein
MNSYFSPSLEKNKKIRKTVRISSQTQEKELSPEVKELNRQNSFSKRERLDAISTISNDPDFKQYLEERRKGTPVKEYRSKILKTLKNRENLLSEIRKRKTQKSKSPSPTKTEDTILIKKTNTKKRIQPQLLSITPLQNHLRKIRPQFLIQNLSFPYNPSFAIFREKIKPPKNLKKLNNLSRAI